MPLKSESFIDYLKKLYHLLGFGADNKTGVKYWKYRVKKLGRLSVVNASHSIEEWNDLTNFQKKEIFPFLKEALSENDKIVLDFGCGPGRFTADLAEIINGRAIGIDPISELLKIAPKAENVEYQLMKEGKIPLKDSSVDVAWICLVLGGLDEITLEASIKEIRRVLRTGGLLCLIENTSMKEGNKHWRFRSVEEYKNLMNFVKLEKVNDYLDCGEIISVMIGRIV
jgi:ubiquinone/menaquinone biosynthesis C-methylase UbiE